MKQRPYLSTDTGVDEGNYNFERASAGWASWFLAGCGRKSIGDDAKGRRCNLQEIACSTLTRPGLNMAHIHGEDQQCGKLSNYSPFSKENGPVRPHWLTVEERRVEAIYHESSSERFRRIVLGCGHWISPESNASRWEGPREPRFPALDGRPSGLPADLGALLRPRNSERGRNASRSMSLVLHEIRHSAAQIGCVQQRNRARPLSVMLC